MTLSVTYGDFAPNTTIVSSQMDQNFDDIEAWANGNIGQDNFSTFTGAVNWSVSSNVLAINISNSGTEGSISIAQSGVLSSSKSGLKVASSSNQTSGAGLVDFALSSSGSTIPVLKLTNAGTGAAVSVTNSNTGAVLDLINSSTGKYFRARTASVDYAELTSDGVLTFIGSRSPGWTSNLGLEAATTTNSNDSIKITGANGSDLSSTNPGYICLPGVTAGTLTVFRITSDVTILLTGAHWGLDTIGDFADLVLRVYAVNDNGSIKWIVANKGALTTIADTATSTTQSNVNTQAKAIANSSISSGTWPVQQMGWFLADFDDTGGAAENLWAVQTGNGEIGVGTPAPVVGDLESVTITGSWTSNTTYAGKRQRKGKFTRYQVQLTCSGTPTSASLLLTLPSGDRIDSTTFASRVVGTGVAIDDGNNEYEVQVIYESASEVRIRAKLASGTYVTTATNVTDTVPFAFGNTDSVRVDFEVPLVGRSEQ